MRHSRACNKPSIPISILNIYICASFNPPSPLPRLPSLPCFFLPFLASFFPSLCPLFLSGSLSHTHTHTHMHTHTHTYVHTHTHTHTHEGRSGLRRWKACLASRTRPKTLVTLSPSPCLCWRVRTLMCVCLRPCVHVSESLCVRVCECAYNLIS